MQRFIESNFVSNSLLLTAVFVLSTAYCLLPTLLTAQTPEWVYQYVNPERSEWPSTIIVDSYANSYTTGLISVAETSGIGIIKLNNNGALGWLYFNDTFGGGAGYDMVFTFDRLFLGGVTGNGHMVAICVDTSGQELWRWFDTLFSSDGNALALSATHHAYVAGLKYPAPSDWMVIKLDSLGSEKWRYVYDGPASSYDEAADIAIDRNENIYVGGYSTGIGTNTDFTVIKLDSAGNEKWVYRYDGPAHARDEIETIALDTSGNVYMTGNSAGIGWDICAIKIDSSGQEKWVYRYNGAANSSDGVLELLVDDSTNVYLAGHVLEDTIGLFTVIKIDTLGNEMWRYCSVGPFAKGGAAGLLAFDGLGAIYAAGSVTNYDNRGQIAIVKLTTAGESLWTYVYPHQPNSPWTDGSRDLVADISGNVYVTGSINISSFNDDIVVMRFAAPVGVEEEVKREEIEYKDLTSIQKNGITILPEYNGVLKIYDVLGRLRVRKVLYEWQNMFIPLPSGIYFIRVERNRDVMFGKVVIL